MFAYYMPTPPPPPPKFKQASMEHETSQFESSETLAAYLASMPLLHESWRQCRRANAASQRSFSVDRVGKVAYVAFSGVQAVDCSEGTCRSLEDLESVFGAFCGEEPVMVHGGLLQLFLFFYHTPNFQQKMLEILNECKSVVFTGHSLGGSLASLSALWLLSVLQTNSPSIEVLCITFGSPMLGNQSFSLAILQERWAGNFFHVVAQYDILPRLLFTPTSPFVGQLHSLFEFWQLSMASPYSTQLSMTSPYSTQLSSENITELFKAVLACAEERLRGGEDGERRSLFWPFGSYMFCTENGAICLDNGMAIVKMLYLMIVSKGSVDLCVEDHLKYESYVEKVCWQYLQKNSLRDMCFSESTNEAGIELALQSLGIDYQEPIYGFAKNCLAVASQLGCKRSLNNAKMAVSLAKITPLRAQIEWYKSFCDNSSDQLGYYDSFKQRNASKRGSKVNMNRIRLGKFWDEVINMMETNQLTHDFHKLPKYVNASQFYKLLVEPLEIAEYYRTAMHKKRGHYIEHGRDRKFKIFDKWWRDRKFGDEERNTRSRFASLTQDSCFWARAEEARDYMNQFITSGMDLVWLDKIEKFERYARGMIERKEVSLDVLAKNSSYNMFREEWEVLKSQLNGKVQEFCLDAESTFRSGFHDGKIVS